MSFTFLHPLFLYLLPLAAAPIIFHLFFRVKKRPRPFPTLMFFQRIDPRLSARRKILEWLILALRTLLILFLLLALSKLIWFGAGTTGSVAMVVIVDNSGSMSGKLKGEQSKLREAIAAAQALVASLKEKDTAAVVLLVDDPAAQLPPGLTADKGVLKSGIGRIKETEATGAASVALERAMTLLETSSATRYEIQILTDLQANEWSKTASLRRPRSGTVVVVHHLPTTVEKDPNVALMGIRMPERKILASRRLPLAVHLANLGEFEARGRLNWADDQGNRGTLDLAIPVRAERSAELMVEPQTPGLHWVSVWYEGDQFIADNKASVAFICLEKRPAFFAGKADDFGLLPAAISPSGDGKYSGLVPEFLEPAELTAMLRVRQPMCVVITWAAFATRAMDLTALRAWVEAGGNLLVVPSNSAAAAVTPPNWVGAAVEAVISVDQGVPVMAFKPGAAVFADLRNERGEILIRTIKAFKFGPVKIAEDTIGLLGLEDGKVLLAQKALGKGMIYHSGMAFDPTWSTLPLKGGSLALIQNMALAGEQSTNLVASLVAGDRWLGMSESTAEIEIKTLTGPVLDWKGPAANLPAFPRAGTYMLHAGRQALCVAVRASPKEGNPQYLSGGKVPALESFNYVLKSAATAESVAAEARRWQTSREMFLPFLLLAVACLTLEGWLANPLPRKPKEANNHPLTAKA